MHLQQNEVDVLPVNAEEAFKELVEEIQDLSKLVELEIIQTNRDQETFGYTICDFAAALVRNVPLW